MKTLFTLSLLIYFVQPSQALTTNSDYDFAKFYDGAQAKAYYERLATSSGVFSRAGNCEGTTSIEGWVYPVGLSDLIDFVLHRPELTPQQKQSLLQPQQQTQQQQRSGNPVLAQPSTRSQADQPQQQQSRSGQIQQPSPYQVQARCTHSANETYLCVVGLGQYQNPDEAARISREFEAIPQVEAFRKCF